MGVKYICEIKRHGPQDSPIYPKCHDKVQFDPYWLLLPGFLVCVIGSMLSYVDGLRRSSWYIPVFILLGAINALVFGMGAKWLDNKEKVYTFSLCYDSVIMVAYYLLPLLCFSTRPSFGVLVGSFFVVIGLTVVKIWG